MFYTDIYINNIIAKNHGSHVGIIITILVSITFSPTIFSFFVTRQNS